MLMTILSKNQSKAQVLQCSLAEWSLSLNCILVTGAGETCLAGENDEVSGPSSS